MKSIACPGALEYTGLDKGKDFLIHPKQEEEYEMAE